MKLWLKINGDYDWVENTEYGQQKINFVLNEYNVPIRYANDYSDEFSDFSKFIKFGKDLAKVDTLTLSPEIYDNNTAVLISFIIPQDTDGDHTIIDTEDKDDINRIALKIIDGKVLIIVNQIVADITNMIDYSSIVHSVLINPAIDECAIYAMVDCGDMVRVAQLDPCDLERCDNVVDCNTTYLCK